MKNYPDHQLSIVCSLILEAATLSDLELHHYYTLSVDTGDTLAQDVYNDEINERLNRTLGNSL